MSYRSKRDEILSGIEDYFRRDAEREGYDYTPPRERGDLPPAGRTRRDEILDNVEAPFRRDAAREGRTYVSPRDRGDLPARGHSWNRSNTREDRSPVRQVEDYFRRDAARNGYNYTPPSQRKKKRVNLDRVLRDMDED